MCESLIVSTVSACNKSQITKASAYIRRLMIRPHPLKISIMEKGQG